MILIHLHSQEIDLAFSVFNFQPHNCSNGMLRSQTQYLVKLRLVLHLSQCQLFFGKNSHCSIIRKFSEHIFKSKLSCFANFLYILLFLIVLWFIICQCLLFICSLFSILLLFVSDYWIFHLLL